MKFFNTRLLLIGILTVAAIIRFYGLSVDPPHLTNDEAALGYNAYSILKTGRDEHGEFLPIIFQSFGDWKPGLYIYLSVPSVLIFGLNEFSTRFVGALSGVLAVYLIYLVTNRLSPKKNLGLWSAISLTFAPIAVHFSRGAWEANLSLALALAGIYFFLKGLEKNKYLIVSSVFFGLTLWAYQGAKLSSALILLALLVVYVKELYKVPRKVLFISCALGIVISLPILISFQQGKTGRLEVYSIFSYPRPQSVIQDIIGQDNETQGSLSYNLYHSEALNFGRGILSRYLNHFSGRYLFMEGDWQSKLHGAPNSGILLFSDFFLLIFGFIYFAKNIEKRSIWFIVLWLLLAPLPAALSRDQVQAVRSLNMIAPLAVILGWGSYIFLHYAMQRKLFKFPLLIFGSTLYLFSLIYFWDAYWIHLPKKDAADWQYGYKQMVQLITPIQNNYHEIAVKQDYTQPYIFFLFYQKYDPKKYQEIYAKNFVPSKFGDVGLVPQLDNIVFRDINWQDDQKAKGDLIVVDPIKLPLEYSNDSTKYQTTDIKYPNGNVAFRLIKIL